MMFITVKNWSFPSFLITHDSHLQVIVGKYIEPEIQNTAKSEIKDQHLNSTKAKSILGWESKVTLEHGLTKTVSWYKSYLEKK